MKTVEEIKKHNKRCLRLFKLKKYRAELLKQDRLSREKRKHVRELDNIVLSEGKDEPEA
jgi:hypothetical protein